MKSLCLYCHATQDSGICDACLFSARFPKDRAELYEKEDKEINNAVKHDYSYPIVHRTPGNKVIRRYRYVNGKPDIRKHNERAY